MRNVRADPRGVTYRFEPVPTDVERDPHGNLWVSSLPGGPEDDSLGARGSVYKISGRRGHPDGHRLRERHQRGGDPGGTLYVAELFTNKITRIFQDRKATVVRLDRSLAVEAPGRTSTSVSSVTSTSRPARSTRPGAIIKYRR